MARAFVCGWPIHHSRSPIIHGHWLTVHAVAGSYEAIAVPPGDIGGFFASLRADGFAGGNVTIPHKEAAYAAVEDRDADAMAIGAVNTMWFANGRLCGGNTDAYGFAANLDDRLAGWRDGREALVIGAGGASRAVIHALRQAGYRRSTVVNRTVARAEALAAHFGEGVDAGGLDRIEAEIRSADLIVNTTAAGMDGSEDLAIDLSHARRDAMATDIVYVPLMTPFLRRAAAADLRWADGLGMLLHQAVPGFEKWFGIRPQVTEELRRLVLADLEAHR